MNHEEVDQPPLKIHHLESNINKFISKTTGDACHLWCNLWKNNELKPHSAVMKKALLHWRLLAYLLHSRYRWGNLSYEQKEKTKDFI